MPKTRTTRVLLMLTTLASCSHPPARIAAAPPPPPPRPAIVAHPLPPEQRRFDDADQELDRIYQLLADGMTLDQQLALSQEQTIWLNQRAIMCSYNGVPNISCAAQATLDRTAELAKRLDTSTPAPPPPATATATAPPPTAAAAPIPTHTPALPPTPTPPAPPEIMYTVAATAMPWLWKPGSLNAAFAYGFLDGTAPTTVLLDQLNATPGQSLTIRYVAGHITLGQGTPQTGALGYTGVYDHGGKGATGRPLPSTFMHPYPINLGALVGAFTTDAGTIIGKPFPIGNATTRKIPPSATQLQLGINDDIFGAANIGAGNTGSLTIAVSTSPGA